jgi:hypothetical protein
MRGMLQRLVRVAWLSDRGDDAPRLAFDASTMPDMLSFETLFRGMRRVIP